MNSKSLPVPEEVLEFRNAEAALKESPLSQSAFWRLSAFLMRDYGSNSRGLNGTMQFLREYRLPQRKTLTWLQRHNIASDAELLRSIHKPVAIAYLKYLGSCDSILAAQLADEIESMGMPNGNDVSEASIQ